MSSFYNADSNTLETIRRQAYLIMRFPIRNACLVEVILASTLHTGPVSADQLTNDAVLM